jgi:hypothetical protein
MRVRDHVALSTAGALLLLPRLGPVVAAPWAASILIDVDHLLWYCLHARCLNPAAALRYFNGAHPAHHVGARLLHSFWALALLVTLGARWRGAQLLVLGMGFHVALDNYHQTRVALVRRTALGRDGYTCQRCGTKGADIVAHCYRQPWLLPSYRAECFVSLCVTCHDDAHAPTQRAGRDFRFSPRATLARRQE